jgi:hypothetical protein
MTNNTSANNTSDSNPTLRAASLATLAAARAADSNELHCAATWIASALDDAFVETSTIVEAMAALAKFIASECAQAVDSPERTQGWALYMAAERTGCAVEALALLRIEMLRRDEARFATK